MAPGHTTRSKDATRNLFENGPNMSQPPVPSQDYLVLLCCLLSDSRNVCMQQRFQTLVSGGDQMALLETRDTCMLLVNKADA